MLDPVSTPLNTSHFLLPLVAAAAIVSPLSAEDSWAGKFVIVKSMNIQIKDANDKGEDVVVATLTHISYQVIAEKGERIKVRHNRTEGWLDRNQAVLASEAVTYFTGCIRENPSDANAYMGRARAWSYKGEKESAIKDLTEAVRLDPKNPQAFDSRGRVWSEKKEYEKGISDYDEAIRLDPKYAHAFFDRANAWKAQKEYDKAIQDYNEAIQLNPKYVAAFNNRGIAWGHLKEFDKAILDYNEAIRLDPKDTHAFSNRGLAWSQRKDYDKAGQDYDEAIRLDPNNSHAFYNRGNLLTIRKEYEKAIHDYEETIRLDPKNAPGLNNLAQLLATCPDEKIRNGKKAVELATRACEISEWKTTAGLITLAAAYAEAGDFANAIKWQEKALEDNLYRQKYGDELRRRLQLYKNNKPYRVD